MTSRSIEANKTEQFSGNQDEKLGIIFLPSGPTHKVNTKEDLYWMLLLEIRPDRRQSLIINPRFNIVGGNYDIDCVNPNRCIHGKAA